MGHAAHIAVELARATLRTRYNRSVLGVLWYALGPVTMLFFVSALHATNSFSGVLSLPAVALGLWCFSYFRHLTTALSNALHSSAGLIKNVSVPLVSIFGARTIEAFVIHCIEFLVVFAVFLYAGTIPYAFLLYIPVCAVFTCIGICCGLMLALGSSFADDIRTMWQYIVMVALFTAPVFVNVLPAQRMWYMEFNPLTAYIDMTRALFESGTFLWGSFGILAVWALVLLVPTVVSVKLYGKIVTERL